MKGLERIAVLVNRAASAVAGVALIFLTGVAIANMVSRAVFTPVPGSYELIGFACAAAVALGLGYTQMVKGHVAVTIFTDMLSPAVNRVLDAVNHLVSTAFFTFVGWQIVKWGTALGRSGELSQTLKIPYYPLVWVVGIGFGVLALTILLDLTRVFSPKEDGR
jgi:TRAP-type C4-dicarboxylate transport system permease small subunit